MTEYEHEFPPERYVQDALRVWSPSWPRRVTRRQHWATSPVEAADLLLEAEADGWNWPFISTYSFPDGHTKTGAIPRVDTLMFDFDIDSSEPDAEAGLDAEAVWVRDVAALLSRLRRFAGYLIERGVDRHWRFSLSGKKGVHAYLDFDPISPNAGDLVQFKRGLENYADDLIAFIATAAEIPDLAEFVDVMSTDLGRLTRVPNTLHAGATALFGEPRYCVVVTPAELAEMTPAEYVRLTRQRRLLPASLKRVPSERAHAAITARITNAPAAFTGNTGTYRDRRRIAQYEQQANERITVDDISVLFGGRPCIRSFIERDDAFEHGHASHFTELYVITHFVSKRVPIDVMLAWFAQHPDFDEAWTRNQIEEVISRAYRPIKCETLADRAPQFACASCPITRRGRRAQHS
jgi:hypothetical protein